MENEKKLDNRIWRKDDFFPFIDRRVDMDPSVCEIPEKTVPLVWNYHHDQPPLGVVENIRLEDGEILGDVKIFDHPALREIEALWENGGVRLGGYYTNIQFKDEEKTEIEALWENGSVRLGGYYTNIRFKDGEGTEIGSCILRSVSFVSFPANPRPEVL